MGGSGTVSTSSSGSIPIPRSPIVRSANSMSVASSPGSHPHSFSHPYSHSHSHSHPSLANISMNLPMPLGFGGSLSRPLSALNSPLSSSPQQRPVALLASPVLRPIPRMASASTNGHDRAQRELDGTGQAVSSLSLT
jgi:hypothetical protein